MQSLEEMGLKEKRQAEFVQRAIAIGWTQSDALAAYVVLYRALGMGKEFALICMSELARRRVLGEDFSFEDYIDTETKKVPKLKDTDFTTSRSVFSLKNIISIVSSVKR